MESRAQLDPREYIGYLKVSTVDFKEYVFSRWGFLPVMPMAACPYIFASEPHIIYSWIFSIDRREHFEGGPFADIL